MSGETNNSEGTWAEKRVAKRRIVKLIRKSV